MRGKYWGSQWHTSVLGKMRREGDISDFFPIASCYFPNLFLSAEGKTECEKEDKKETKWVWMEGKGRQGKD